MVSVGGLMAVLVVVLHVAYLGYQMCGGLLALRDRRWLAPHLLAVTWGVVIVAMQWRCPLTRLEKYFWSLDGGTAYVGSFLDHYLFGVLLPDGTQAWVYGAHLLVILAIYVALAVVWSTERRAEAAPAER